MTVAPEQILTPEQIATAQLNGWDLQETANQVARGTLMHELMRKHTKPQLLRMAYAGGLLDYNQPAKWRKDELAGAVADQQLRAAQP